MSALLLLRAVPASALLAVTDPLGVQGAADDLVADSGQIPHPAAPHQHDGVLLQVVADARDIGGDLDVAGQPDPGDLAERGVRLPGGGGVDACADATALRARLERRGLALAGLVLPTLADQLLDRGHRVSVFVVRLGATFVLLSGRRWACLPRPSQPLRGPANGCSGPKNRNRIWPFRDR